MKQAWLFVTVVCVGCGGSDDDPTGPVTIGPEGGTVASADGIVELVIPPGAVAGDTVFEITASPQAAWPADVADRDPIGGKVYDIQPDGTLFAVPATLTWTYATAPTNAFDETNPFLLFGATFGAELGFNTDTSTDLETGLVATTSIEHLSLQFLTAKLGGGDIGIQPTAAIEADLVGGEHFVDFPWSARSIVANPFDAAEVHVRAENQGVPTVMPLKDPPWDRVLFVDEAATGFIDDPGAWSIDVPDPLGSMPRWVCTAPGTGKAKLTYFAQVQQLFIVNASVSFSEDVTCLSREEKAEYLEHQASLGANRIENLAVPATDMQDLAASSGQYGWIVPVAADQTVEVCVSTTGSASVLDFPHFPPGFIFLDTSPGCTNITGAAPELPNDVLVEVTGSGTITITTRVIGG